MAAPQRPPPQELDFFSDGPETVTVYLSPPHCPELRTRAWLEFVGFPRHLWSQRRAAACRVRFGGVAHLDAAEFRRSGRMIVEARVTRVTEVPKRVAVTESVRAPGAVLPVGIRRHSVRLVVLSAEPVHEEEDGKGRMHEKQRTARALDEQVGTQERPDSVDCYL